MQWAWLIPVFSFAAAPVIVVIGNRLPGKGALLSIAAIGAGFVFFWIALFGWMDASAATTSGAGSEAAHCQIAAGTEALTCNYERTWFNAGLPGLDGSVVLTWGFFVDPLTIAMLGLVTFVALMVQIYSLGYMRGDPRINWYFAVHALFAASMLTIILSDSFLLLYVAWELVGVCSYLLIGFWHERPAAREAAKKAFIVTRIGDVGLLIGILLLWHNVGTFSMTDAFEAVQAGTISEGVTIAAALLLFLGAMGKSAQIPFHVWLPDAMEGPTPVSALIHAATMVVAGVFLVARAYPLFEAYNAVPLLVVAIVGLVTALVTATIALVATDIKRILAYSTVSHLGLMMLSLGAFGYTAAIFHLLAHGFAKALLFLGSGSVIHSTGEQEISKLGGLRRVMPLTTIVFAIGAMSLGGIPILAGFWSKDEMLQAVSHGRNPAFIVFALITALLSALYMGRALFATFFGRLPHELEHTHESPPVMTVPLMLLAILAVGFGLISWNWPGAFGGFGYFVFYPSHTGAGGHGFEFTWWIGILSAAMAIGAFVFTYLVYERGSISLESFQRTGRREDPAGQRRLASALRAALYVIENKYYFDEVYQWTIDRVVLVFAGFVGFFDRAIVNDVGINGPADAVRRLGITLRLHVTGHVYSYALAMVLGTVAMGVFWWLLT